MIREKLVQAGIDYDGGLNRFAGNKAVYEKFIVKFFETDYMEKLLKNLTDKDYNAAFRTAHDLKGTSGNLSMNAFYDVICELVEQVRDGHPDNDCMKLYSQAKKLYDLAEKSTKE